jgi:hypothetical protein
MKKKKLQLSPVSSAGYKKLLRKHFFFVKMTVADDRKTTVHGSSPPTDRISEKRKKLKLSL